MKVAAAPTPLAKGLQLPLPARVVTFHTQGGSALIPTPAQFTGVMQGMAGAGVPPGQKYPALQVAHADPKQYVPGAQGGQAACKYGRVLTRIRRRGRKGAM